MATRITLQSSFIAEFPYAGIEQHQVISAHCLRALVEELEAVQEYADVYKGDARGCWHGRLG